jgi:hypothetical protein
LLSGLTVGGSSSSPAANGNSGSLLSGFSPVKQQPTLQQQQQRPQLMGMQPMQQQQLGGLQVQPDLLGDFSMAAARPQQQMMQQQPGFGMLPLSQVREVVARWLGCACVASHQSLTQHPCEASHWNLSEHPYA